MGEPLEDFGVRETRGFVTRKGLRKCLERRRKPGAPQETRGRHKYSASVGSAGGNGCPSSSCCKTGRHRGVGGCRSLKKSKGHPQRGQWEALKEEASNARTDAIKTNMWSKRTSGVRKTTTLRKDPPPQNCSHEADSGEPVDIPNKEFVPLRLGRWFGLKGSCRCCVETDPRDRVAFDVDADWHLI